MKRTVQQLTFQKIAQYVAASVLLCASPLAQSPVIPDEILKEFDDRVKRYMELHKLVKSTIPPMKTTTDPTKIAAHEAAMDARLRAARAGAQQGDIFIPAIQPYFVQVIRSETKGAAGAKAREMIKEGNPSEGNSTGISVKANGMYPGDAPLSTVPPDLLRKLPPLPKELEYRFVGRHLILRDVAANIIVDYIPNAAPQG
jgi:hypothetical protein